MLAAPPGTSIARQSTPTKTHLQRRRAHVVLAVDEDLFTGGNEEGFECAVGVQFGRITVKAQCAVDVDFEGCVCESHDHVVEIEPLPKTLSATIRAFDKIPCGASPNLD